jgi:UDP-N-acetylglucosamine transferase subunit ALG13
VEIPFAELQQQMATADVIIGHAGCGTALAALNAGRLPLLSPRTSAKHELVDDHQVQIAEWLSERGLAILREAGQITWQDIVDASTFRVGKLRNPPCLRLAG